MATLIIFKGKEVVKECGQNHSIVLFREREREREREGERERRREGERDREEED